MRKPFRQFETVPVKVVEKILEQQTHFTKNDEHLNVKRKPVARKLRRAARRLSLVPKKSEVLTS
jgi:hypothetical protein